MRRLAIDVAIAYAAAWLIGLGFGMALRRTHVWQGGASWERAMLRDFHAHALPTWLDQAMIMMPLVGTNLLILPVVLTAGLWLWKRRHQPITALQLLIVSIGSLSMNPTMKYLLDRDRPDLFPQRGMFNWASYPSGHAILTTALYFTLALMLWRARRWRWPFAVGLAIVLVTCYSRIYLSVHWPTDIIGGLMMGAVWLAGTWLSFSRYRRATSTASADGADRGSVRIGTSADAVL